MRGIPGTHVGIAVVERTGVGAGLRGVQDPVLLMKLREEITIAQPRLPDGDDVYPLRMYGRDLLRRMGKQSGFQVKSW